MIWSPWLFARDTADLHINVMEEEQIRVLSPEMTYARYQNADGIIHPEEICTFVKAMQAQKPAISPRVSSHTYL